MVMAVVELTARLRGEHLDRVHEFAARKQHDGGSVTETMLDLLDLYVQHHKSTKIGALFDLSKFIDVKIRLNTDLDATGRPRYLHHCHKCEVEDAHPLSSTTASATDPTTASNPWPADASIRRTARGQDGTMRFVFDPAAAKDEQETVGHFFKDEFEEYEVEVDEAVPPPDRDDAGRARGGYRGGYRDRGDHRRGAPYSGYRGDRYHRGRGRYH
jgi:CTD kinase subunit beta